MRNSDATGRPGTAANQSTKELVVRVQSGDDAAREVLFRRYRPRLERLVHGHLPAGSRAISDTQDVVQSALCHALSHLDRYEYRHEGGFLAWLRTITRHVIVDQLRLAKRRPMAVSISDELESKDPSPVERAIGVEDMEIYERALHELPEQQRHAVIMRLEYGMSYSEISAALQRPSPNATRMMIHRAIRHVARRVRELEGEP